jgi:diguanylate cyclase (GGDEF)-like protein
MSESPSTSPAGSRILVVEDDTDMSMVVREALKALGHQVQEAATLTRARELLGKNSIELILSDVHLGESESGITLLREVAPRSPDLSVVIMTGNSAPQVAIECLREGAFDYLLKPFNLDELKTVIARVTLRQRQMIAERDRVESQLHILGKFSSENPNPVLRVAQDGLILYCNDAGQRLLKHFDCQAGQSAPSFLREHITDVFGRGKPGEIEVVAAGQTFSFAVTPIKEADYVYLYGHDITRLKQTEQELIRLKDQAQELALHDGLTGLPNRMLLEDRLQFAMAQCERTQTKLGIVFIDLDHFKEINDTYGHRIGDQVLLAVTRRLREAIRRTDTLARWGGDELILLLPEISGADEARLVCERLKGTVQRQIAQDQIRLAVTLSLGITIYPDDAFAPGTLMQQADAALYLAKSRGRDQVVLFSDSAEIKAVREKANLRALLSRAVAEGRIQVWYQLIVETTTCRPVGVEALARWYEESVGWIAPSTFIPLAENMGLISSLGQQVLDSATRQLSEWKKQGLTPTLSVNVSIRQVMKEDFLKVLGELLAKYELKPSDIILELTESQALLGLASEFKLLEQISQSGFRISVDDFGQGYSSLSSLHELPVSELKIDMKFVRNLQAEKGRRIVFAIVEMARALGLETVAEGVEDPVEAETLKKMAVTRLQGYLFGKPLPAPEVAALLR